MDNPDLVMEIQDRVLREVGLIPSLPGDEDEAGVGAEVGAETLDPDDQPITLD